MALLYKAATSLRHIFCRPAHVGKPVICVGNIVMGGAGKTPTVIALAQVLQAKGLHPHILTRGYGAHVPEPVCVAAHHSARDVGDEPLLLARAAPTWVCPDRAQSAQAAIGAGADILIMDDGFQNPRLYKDSSLIVIDGMQGVGNGCVFPAGPLRETLAHALTRADAVILIGEDQHNLAAQIDKPLLRARIEVTNVQPGPVVAFSGLGFPDKFLRTLSTAGYEIVDSFAFPDHHPYSEEEIEKLIACATEKGVQLVTTEKDLCRIPAKYHPQIQALAIRLVFEDEKLLELLWTKLR